jgi:hypothetical protein
MWKDGWKDRHTNKVKVLECKFTFYVTSLHRVEIEVTLWVNVAFVIVYWDPQPTAL